MLSGRTALVPGARRGIGRAIVLALAHEGAAVAVTDLSADDCKPVAAEVTAAGGTALALACDVTDRASVDAAVARTVADFGGLDILVNNATWVTVKPFLRVPEADLDQCLAVNLKGTFICSQSAARPMVKSGWGRIVNIASISSGGVGNAFPLLSHYTAAKGGVRALTEAMAQELAPHGINVNAVCPGSIETEGLPQSVRERALRRIPKGRLGYPQEIAQTVVFLVSEASEYITGISVAVDGGWLTT